MPTELERRFASALAAPQVNRPVIEGARDAAVLIPIVAGLEPSLIFTVRTETLPSHKGQISFPGGSIDAGESAETAALREAEEEIGLDRSRVRILAELDTIPTFVSGYVVSPFVGWVETLPELRPNPLEVAEVLQVPLTDLVDDIRAEPGFVHAGRTYPTEAWVWHDHVIWGVTARILRIFLEKLAAADLIAAPADTTSWSAWPVASAGP